MGGPSMMRRSQRLGIGGNSLSPPSPLTALLVTTVLLLLFVGDMTQRHMRSQTFKGDATLATQPPPSIMASPGAPRRSLMPPTERLLVCSPLDPQVGCPPTLPPPPPQGRYPYEASPGVPCGEVEDLESKLPRTTFECDGEDWDNIRCVLHDALIVEGRHWLITDDLKTARNTFPPLLCSVANAPESFKVLCDVEVLSPAEAVDRLRSHPTGESLCHLEPEDGELDLSIPIHFLNTFNVYHAVFEGLVVVYEMLRQEGIITACAQEAHNTLQAMSWAVVLADRQKAFAVPQLVSALFPNGRVIERLSLPRVFRVKKALMGPRASCPHHLHCLPANRGEGYAQADVPLDFRRLVLHTLGHEDRESYDRCIAISPAPGTTPPRVTIIQRSGTRQISNVGELVSVVNETAGVGGLEPKVVDMARLTLVDQLKLAMHTDIFILVHGAALAHALWQPFGAMVLDIYPYHMPASFAGELVHWVRRSLPALELLHHPFDIINPQDQEQNPGTPSTDCQCPDYQEGEDGFYFCGMSFFWETKSLRVDPSRFRSHFQRGLQLWAQHRYTPPLSRSEFREGWGSGEGRRPEYYLGSKPLCDWKFGPRQMGRGGGKQLGRRRRRRLSCKVYDMTPD